MTKTTSPYCNALDPSSRSRWIPIKGLEHIAEELTLSIDPVTGEYTRLTRFLPGADTSPFGGKMHPYPEEVFVVSGRLYDKTFDLWLEAGHYASRPPGELHGPFKTDVGCVVLEVSFPDRAGDGLVAQDSAPGEALQVACQRASTCVPGLPNYFIAELKEKHIEQLHALYQGEWWTRGRSLEDTRQCVRGSQICIGITSENDDLIGFVRVLTDFIFKALIFDLIVAQSERGRGLGNKLLTLVRNHERLRAVRTFELYCLPEMFTFYERHGFSTNAGGVKLMRLANS